MRRLLLALLPLVLLLTACGSGSDGSVEIARVAPPPTPFPGPPPPRLCLVTRERGVTAAYVPDDLTTIPAEWSFSPGVQLRAEPAAALLRLFQTARLDGFELIAVSGYRSFQTQATTLLEEIRTYGETQARRQVAEPGHSEHQLGIAMDVTSRRDPGLLEASFGKTPEGQWLAANAPRFGFVVSYPEGKEQITGYIYEPWHIRYVGVQLAQEIARSGMTVTEFLPKRGLDGC
jgi:D-alanyl-D-alanine carboxypeptidase